MSNYLSAEMKQFNYLSSEITATYHDAAVKMGLSDSAMMVLYAICNHGEECLINDIVRLSGISKQTINSALRKLERADIVYLRNFSGRKKKVCLTENGKALAKSTVCKIIEIENEIFHSWSKDEREAYIQLTQKYLSMLKEKVASIDSSHI